MAKDRKLLDKSFLMIFEQQLKSDETQRVDTSLVVPSALHTVGTPNKATKNFREIGSNKVKFCKKPIAIFASFAISSQIRQILATSQTF